MNTRFYFTRKTRRNLSHSLQHFVNTHTMSSPANGSVAQGDGMLTHRVHGPAPSALLALVTPRTEQALSCTFHCSHHWLPRTQHLSTRSSYWVERLPTERRQMPQRNSLEVIRVGTAAHCSKGGCRVPCILEAGEGKKITTTRREVKNKDVSLVRFCLCMYLLCV
jgi:hypothetical protein